MKYLFLIFLIACSSSKKSEDTLEMKSIFANDTTAIVQGCGHQPIVGYTYCRKVIGDSTNEKLVFHAPPDIQSFGTIYLLDGSLIGFQFKNGRAEISWKELLKSDKFTIDDRGLYLFTIRSIVEPDINGEDKEIYQEGEIRLRLIKPNYKPLHNVEFDPSYFYEWSDSNFLYKMTSGGRAYVGYKKPTSILKNLKGEKSETKIRESN